MPPRLYKKAQSFAGPIESASGSKKFVEERVRKEMAEKLKRVETKTKKKEKPKVNTVICSFSDTFPTGLDCSRT